MLWIIVHKELLNNILNLRFFISFLVCLIVIPFSAYMLTEDYKERLDSYYVVKKKHEEQLKEVTVYSYLHPTVDRKPETLSIFSKGVEEQLGNSATIEVGDVPMVVSKAGRENPFLASFPSMDLVSIIALLMSLLALLFSYDAISGERERGTLNLMMSNAVPRSTVLLGKYIGGIVSLLLPFCAALNFALLVIQADGVTFSKEELLGISFVFLLSLVFVSVFFTIGMLFSTVARESATALMLSLFSWVMLAMIIPNASVFIASQLRGIAPERQEAAQKKAILAELQEKISLYEAKHQPQNRSTVYSVGNGHGGFIIRAMLKELPQIIENFLHRKPTPEEIKSMEVSILRDIEWRQELFAYSVPLRIDYADKIGQLYQRRFRELEYQVNLAITLSRISPSAQLLNIASALAQTDLVSHIRFLSALRQYRRQFIQYLEEKTGKFSSLRWFNDEEDAELSIADMPKFEFPRESFPSALKRTMIDIFLLFTLNILFFMGAYVYFLRSDLK